MSAANDPVFARLFPPRPLDPLVLEALLLRLASDPTDTPLVFEARSRAEAAGSSVEYWFGCGPEHLRWLRRTLHDYLPGLLLDPHPSAGRTPVTAAARLQLRPPQLALAVDRPVQVSTAVLSALSQQLHAGEQLVVQVLLGRRRSPQHPRGSLADPNQPWWRLLTSGVLPAPTAVRKQHELRFAQAGIATCIRLGVSADDRRRQQRLLAGLLGGISTAKAAGTFVSLRRDRPARLHEVRLPRWWSVAPAASELVGLLAWPLGDGELPGLPPLHPKLLPAPKVALPAGDEARVIGRSSVPGDQRLVGLAASDSLFHAVATGPTGSGKSTALLRLIRADIHAGRAVVVIDPKRQLIDDIIERAVPASRIGDVVIIDPVLAQPPGINPLDIGDRDPDVVVDGLLAVFAAVFRDGWGPRTQDIIHAGLLSLARAAAAQPGRAPYTILDLPRLLTDPAFRRAVIGHVADDPGLGPFWAWYQAQSPQALAVVLAPVMNKLRQFVLRPSVRRILGDPSPTFRLRDVFRDRKIVLVPLNAALIGPITAQLIGGLVVAETWAATLERANEVTPTARPASVWIDEVQNYLHLPTALDEALNASRSMGVGWHIAHQFRAQLPPDMAAAVDSNARTKIVFRPDDPKDAAAFARQAPELTDRDFLALPRFSAYARIVASGEPQPWCSIQTLPPPEPTGLGAEIRAASRANYGGSAAGPAAVGDPPPQPAIGRKRRVRTEQSDD